MKSSIKSLFGNIQSRTHLSTPKTVKRRVIYPEFVCGRSSAHVTIGPKIFSLAHPSLPGNVFFKAPTTSSSELRGIKVGRFANFRPTQRLLADRYRNRVESVDLITRVTTSLPSSTKIVHGEFDFPNGPPAPLVAKNHWLQHGQHRNYLYVITIVMLRQRGAF